MVDPLASAPRGVGGRPCEPRRPPFAVLECALCLEGFGLPCIRPEHRFQHMRAVLGSPSATALYLPVVLAQPAKWLRTRPDVEEPRQDLAPLPVARDEGLQNVDEPHPRCGRVGGGAASGHGQAYPLAFPLSPTPSCPPLTQGGQCSRCSPCRGSTGARTATRCRGHGRYGPRCGGKHAPCRA